MGSEVITVTVYRCDNPDCSKEETYPKGQFYPGFEGCVDVPASRANRDGFEEKAWTACSEACLAPSIVAIWQNWMSGLVKQ